MTMCPPQHGPLNKWVVNIQVTYCIHAVHKTLVLRVTMEMQGSQELGSHDYFCIAISGSLTAKHSWRKKAG